MCADRKKKKIKAISLLSGGLDSILATRLIMEHGIEVEALNFVTVFCTCTSKGKTCLAGKSAADTLGVKLKVLEISKDYFEIIKNPKYGYGRNLNPCLDCRIFIFKKAAEYMKETGASFIVTGEVLGERPMSQRREAMMIIERDSGLKGFIVRPLTARLFDPTIPEKKGWVDREKFLSIKGRSRKPQIQLAKDFKINDYPCPAGGCLLTDKGFANRMRDLMANKKDFNVNDVRLLKTGRHFRITPEAKLAVGRDENENNRLEALSKENDLYFRPVRIKGPIGIGRGDFDEKTKHIASRIIARYSDSDLGEKLKVSCKAKNGKGAKQREVLPLHGEELEALRI